MSPGAVRWLRKGTGGKSCSHRVPVTWRGRGKRWCSGGDGPGVDDSVEVRKRARGMPGPRSCRDAAAGSPAGAAVLLADLAVPQAGIAVHGEHWPAPRVRESCRAGAAAGPSAAGIPGVGPGHLRAAVLPHRQRQHRDVDQLARQGHRRSPQLTDQRCQQGTTSEPRPPTIVPIPPTSRITLAGTLGRFSGIP